MSSASGLPSYFGEREWLASDDPCSMLNFLAEYHSATKLGAALPGERLTLTLARYQLACLELVERHIVADRTQRVVAALRRFVDRQGTYGEVVLAAEEARRRAGETPSELNVAERVTMDVVHSAAFHSDEPRDLFMSASNTAIGVTLAVALPPAPGDAEAIQQRQSRLKDETRLALARRLREVLGNPFRRPPFQAAWCTPTVRRLAQSVYESRDFSILPILADALEEEGGHDELTQHLRQSEPHHRYCWAIADVLDAAHAAESAPQ